MLSCHRNHNPKLKQGRNSVGVAPRSRFGLRTFPIGDPFSNGKQLRRGSAYLAVTGASLIIAMISLTSMHLARLELRDSVSRGDMAYAQRLAQASVEFAVAQIEYYDGGSLRQHWRNRFDHNVEVNKSPSGYSETFSFRLLDHEDGDLADDHEDPIEIQGIGRWGSAVYVYSVTCSNAISAEEQVGPVVARNYEGGTSTEETVDEGNYLGQYFMPSLPAGATQWQITGVEVFLSGHGALDKTLDVTLYESDAGGMPATLIESVSVQETALPASGSPDWHSVTFTAATNLDPAGGFCIGLERTGGGGAAIVPYDTGVSQTDSHILRGGSGTWYNIHATQSLQYRVHGIYTTSSGTGEFQIEPGSWKRAAAP